MQHNPTDRPTAAEALEHPWLTDEGGSAASSTKELAFKKKNGAKLVTKDQHKYKGKHTRVQKKDHVCTTSM